MLPSRVRILSDFRRAEGGHKRNVSCDRSITDKVCNIARASSEVKSIVHILGKPGCGKTTYLLEVATELQEQEVCSAREILFLACSPGCNPTSLLRCLAQEFPLDVDVEESTLIIKENEYNEKLAIVRAALQNLLLNFRVVLLDDVNFQDVYSVFKFIVTCLEELREIQPGKALPTLICTSSGFECSQMLELNALHLDFHEIDLKNLSVKEAKIQLSDFTHNYSTDPFISSVTNAKSRKLLATLFSDNWDESKGLFLNALFKDETLSSSNILWEDLLVLSFNQLLTSKEKFLFKELCFLREPVPCTPQLKDDLYHISKLGLVSLSYDEDGNSLAFVTRSTKQILEESCDQISLSETWESLTAFSLWENALFPELKGLLEAASMQEWAFVPEKWQYKDIVGEEERYNIKDIIMRKCKYSSRFQEIDILEEMLYHALKTGHYVKASSIMFLMDRFMYTQGTIVEFMHTLDLIQKRSPQTPIAPQMIIRKARLLKDKGDLQGAEKILSSLDSKGENPFHWSYKNEADQQVQSAVCLQIRGDVRRNLGFWLEGCRMLLETVELFKAVKPMPDKKGWASSLTLIANALQYIPYGDYEKLSQEYNLTAPHPMIEAMRCLEEAAELCVYTPLFYLKNKRILGEMYYFYSKLCKTDEEKKEHQLRAAHEFRDSIACHQSIARLESQEQYFQLVCSLLRLSYVCLEEFQDKRWKSKGKKLLKIALYLFHHYCMSAKKVKHSNLSILLIESALRLVQLPEIPLGESVYLNRLGIPDARVHIAKPIRALTKDKTSDEPENLRLVDTILSTWENDLDFEERREGNCNFWDVGDIHLRFRQLSTSETDEEVFQQFRDATTVVTLEEIDHQVGLHIAESEQMFDTWKPQSHVLEDRKREKDIHQSLGTLSYSDRNMEDTIAAMESAEEENLLNKVIEKLEIRTLAVYPAIVASYDPVSSMWKVLDTVAFLGDFHMKGKCRSAYHFKHLAQEDPLGRYLGKQYMNLSEKRNCRQQYMQDVACQMVSRQYAGYFNRALINAGQAELGQVHFLPSVMVKLHGDDDDPRLYFNVEPYVASGFEKFSNNATVGKTELPSFDLLMAFSHYSHHLSNGNHLVVDIQGFTTDNGKGQIYLTDPQILTRDKIGFGTGNIGPRGMAMFWNSVHKECNAVCNMLNLKRPDH